MPAAPSALPISFLPTLRAEDPLAEYWLRNVTLRLRRELCWLWRERAPAIHRGEQAIDALPPITDRVAGVLDLARYAADKRRFFATDETAVFLSELITQPPPPASGRPTPERGSFSWVARELELTEVDCFVLALALGPAIDGAAGAVYAACLNDATRTAPNLALAQRLWDPPAQLMPFASGVHALFTQGLIAAPASPNSGATAWEAPLIVPPMIAATLLAPDEAASPFQLIEPMSDSSPISRDAAVVASRTRSIGRRRLRLIPTIGPRGAPLAGYAAGLCAHAKRRLATPVDAVAVSDARESRLSQWLTLAWMHGLDLYLDAEMLGAGPADGHSSGLTAFPLGSLPLTVFVGLHDRTLVSKLPEKLTLPPVHVPTLSYRERLELWSDHLPGARRDATLAVAVAECARRFRYERETILDLCRDLQALGRPVRPDDLIAVCRADLELGELAQPVVPRFRLDELMLPPKETLQMRELIHAMRMLTTVHYDWGTAGAWNEGGLSALFAGPPGTGKTMGAEVIAAELELPLFRIDLSQVVNKYIGETEKNLRRVFDAAEASDVILFFDEADSLFGKRTEVKDAHDRYANLEVSYLLERMERFKGLAILATNRKKDLDDAFLRRLRFVIDFPLPGVDERLRIWRRAMPDGVETTGVDFAFLAQRFPLAGGHIRSIVFHACLQAAAPGAPRKLTMPTLIAAVKREYDKLDRSLSLEQYRPYASIVEKMQ